MQKRKVSRTMEWLKLPPKVQKKFAKNLLSVGVDYLQYTCYDISNALSSLYSLGFTGEIDIDNSNIEYNLKQNLSLVHNLTNMGHAYMLTFLSTGFPPIPVLSVEVYTPNQVKTLGTEGKVVFYGAYFVFREVIQDEAPEIIDFYNLVEHRSLICISQNNKPMYKRTRVDVAVDVSLPLDQKWMKKYIRPHKTSRSVPKPYNYQEELGGWQSISYIPRLNRGIGIRIYNKILDIQAKNKQAWYPQYLTGEYPSITRMEIVYAGDIASKITNELMEYTKFRLLGKNDIMTQLTQSKRPQSLYSPLSAFNYFERYAKNHGISIDQLLNDVMQVWMQKNEISVENLLPNIKN